MTKFISLKIPGRRHRESMTCDDFRRWENELAPGRPECAWTPLVLAGMVAAICVLLAVVGLVALMLIPFVLVAGTALLILRRFGAGEDDRGP
jgi:hypothetical protein